MGKEKFINSQDDYHTHFAYNGLRGHKKVAAKGRGPLNKTGPVPIQDSSPDSALPIT